MVHRVDADKIFNTQLPYNSHLCHTDPEPAHLLFVFAFSCPYRGYVTALVQNPLELLEKFTIIIDYVISAF